MNQSILLLDNNSQDLFALSKALDRQGYTVYPVTNLSNATVVLRDNHPDIVMINWEMPDKEIRPFVDLIKKQLATIEFIYTIAMATTDKPYNAVEALEGGMDDFIYKPVSGGELFARLHAASRIISLQKNLRQKCEELIKVSGELRILNRKNEQLARTDELTSLGNRREAMSRLKECWSLCERHDTNMACIYIDIDHFKDVNDTHGHEIGDLALKHVSKLLSESTRTEEAVFRLGGEEFIIICPITNLESARQTGERMRQVIEKNPMAFTRQPPDLKMTVSIGVAVKQEDTESPDDLLSRADKQLYCAKERGRNRVC